MTRSGEDAILREATFVITDEYVDLPKLEKAILEAIPFKLRSGTEWFIADFDEVVRLIERFLSETQLTWV